VRLGKRARADEDGAVNVFFATDLHGSDICFKKFLSTPTVYQAHVLILGGDLTGKLAIPIVDHGADLEVIGPARPYVVSRDQRHEVEAQMLRAGFYPFVIQDSAEIEAYRADPRRVEAKLAELMRERLLRWGEWAEEKLSSRGIEIFVAPGNDDPEAVDEVIAELPQFRLVEGQVLSDVCPGLPFELLSTGYSNVTPWATHRELPEPELKGRLEKIAAGIRQPAGLIFNIHVPPFGSTLDEGPLIEKDTLKVTTGIGQAVTVPVGSTAVREFIEELQPVVSLHGHIHESRAIGRIGHTVAINPGSDYSDGILRGAFLTFTARGLERYQLTTG
jgi:Icc-related predicted phosphoesterase